MIDEHVINVGRARIHRLEAGSGDPIVLLHGLGWSSGVWLDVIDRLAGARRVLAFDLPGHGRSDAPSGPYTPAWLAGAVRGALDELDIERAVLVGNSLGGTVALTLAAAAPERVRALALISPALPNEDPPADRRDALRFLAAALPALGPAVARRRHRQPAARIVDERLAQNLVDPSRVSARVREALIADVERVASSPAHVRALALATRSTAWAVTGRREATWRTARAVHAPALLLWGEHDKRLPVAIAARAVEAIGGSQLIRLPDAGHTPQAEVPDEVAGAITAFLRSLAVPAGRA